MTRGNDIVTGSLPELRIAAKEVFAHHGGNVRTSRKAMIDTRSEYIYRSEKRDGIVLDTITLI